MRHRILPALLAGGLLVTGSTAALAGPEDGDGGGTTLTLYAVEASFTYITATGEVLSDDEAESEQTLPSAGDRFVFVDELYADEARTERVGRNDGECTFTAFTGETEEEFQASLVCHGVVTVDDTGSLAWQGALQFSAAEVDPEQPFATVAVTGGTGGLVGADGQVRIFDTTAEGDEQSTTRYEVELLG
ncbi:hypothetical protein [Egicoccus sp. AB-alg2]|uniref:hypothetical protein n=1 Tax=Egicoccus sp. AB-alg2 TaxID=3242693 RepID=UPI00359E02B7